MLEQAPEKSRFPAVEAEGVHAEDRIEIILRERERLGGVHLHRGDPVRKLVRGKLSFQKICGGPEIERNDPDSVPSREKDGAGSLAAAEVQHDILWLQAQCTCHVGRQVQTASAKKILVHLITGISIQLRIMFSIRSAEAGQDSLNLFGRPVHRFLLQDSEAFLEQPSKGLFHSLQTDLRNLPGAWEGETTLDPIST